MPAITDPKLDTESDAMGTFRAELLSDVGGLSQFGAFTETLTPGSRSSNLHCHLNEDDFAFVLTGTVTLREGDALTDMPPGTAATFKAGAPVGHYLINCTDAPVTYLVVGTRSGDDTVTYPLTDEVLTVKDGLKTLREKEGTVIRTEPYNG